MQNIHELLRRKEIELEKVTKEIHAIRLTVQLLEEENRREAGNGRTAVTSINKSSGSVATHSGPENLPSAKQQNIQEFP